MPTLAVMIGFHFMEGSSASELSRIAHYTPRLLYIKHHNLNPMRTKRLNDGKLEAGRVGLPLHLRPWKVVTTPFTSLEGSHHSIYVPGR